MNPSFPIDAVAAVTHADPYPYYAMLRQGPPLVFDPAARVWVASRAEVIAQALGCSALRVRPLAEPVPRAIAETPAGELFSRLVRMNDGPLHDMHKPPLRSALAGVDAQATREAARRVAATIECASLDEWCFAMPLCTMAALLGFKDAQLLPLAEWTRAFVACLSPLSTPDQLLAASDAASKLLDRFEAMLESPRAGSLVESVRDDARRQPACQRNFLLANLVGLLSQTCEATAGLVGNGIVAMAREPALFEAFTAHEVDIQEFVAEVALHDPSTHNTRRFLAEPATLAGVTLTQGDAVLLVLAAANRDPALNAEPDRFNLARPDRKTLGFGHGPHACPGQALALTIAAAALESFRDNALRGAGGLPTRWRYRPSVNVRIPVFDC